MFLDSREFRALCRRFALQQSERQDSIGKRFHFPNRMGIGGPFRAMPRQPGRLRPCRRAGGRSRGKAFHTRPISARGLC